MTARLIAIVLSVVLVSSSFAEVSVKLGRPRCIPLGAEVSVPVMLENDAASLELGGFDLLIEYNSNLTFQYAQAGEALQSCDWDYFWYFAEGTNRVRLSAIADIDNGPYHPSCFGTEGGELASLRFLVPSDSGFVSNFLPIGFIWGACDDNTVPSRTGDTVCLSNTVIDYNGAYEFEITGESAFPTDHGARDECLSSGLPDVIRLVDFYNGGITLSASDCEPPVAICAGDTMVVVDAESCGAHVEFNSAATDNLDSVTVSCQPPSGSFFTAGWTTVACIAVDAAGNADTCTFVVNVLDTIPPTVTCPDTVIEDSDPGQCGAVVRFTVPLYDNCEGSVLSMPSSASFFDLGSTVVRNYGVDGSGNIDSCQFVVVVFDDEPPQIEYQPPILVSADSGLCGAFVDFDLSVWDNCEPISVVANPPSGSFFPIGITEVLLSATDASGLTDSATLEITVVDSLPPQIDAPLSLVISNDPGECGAIVDYGVSVTDNCPGVVLEVEPANESFLAVGEHTVTAIATDAGGLADTVSFLVTVADDEAPQVVCPDNIEAESDLGDGGVLVDFEVLTSDNCPGLSVSSEPSSGSIFPVGTTLVEVVVIDGAANHSTCSFDIVVERHDADDDGVADVFDNCPTSPNTDQIDSDDDGVGDSCDLCPGYDDFADVDQDSIADGCDNCPGSSNAMQEDGDMDGVGDVCDVCPGYDDLADGDTDSVPDSCDNCPSIANVDQVDSDGDGRGDLCCCTIRGDVDYSGAGPDIADLIYMVTFMFQSGPPAVCPETIDIDANGGMTNIADLVTLVTFMFQSGPPLALCP